MQIAHVDAPCSLLRTSERFLLALSFILVFLRLSIDRRIDDRLARESALQQFFCCYLHSICVTDSSSISAVLFRLLDYTYPFRFNRCIVKLSGIRSYERK